MTTFSKLSARAEMPIMTPSITDVDYLETPGHKRRCAKRGRHGALGNGSPARIATQPCRRKATSAPEER